MIKLKETLLQKESFINESVYDRGVFKVIFFAGLPGAGKSYTISKISSGRIQPRIVNFDKYAEYLVGKYRPESDAGDLDKSFIDKSKQMTSSQLTLYINSMLPLFIDSTSNKNNRTLMRNGIIKSLGYDTGMIWINTSLETAIKRVKQRNRSVPEQFIREVYESIQENITYYRREFSNFFVEIKNDEGELTDTALTKAFVKVSSFFESPIENPIGKKNLELAQWGNGYLVPSVFSPLSKIKSKLMNWY
jgi:shikimate kinase